MKSCLSLIFALALRCSCGEYSIKELSDLDQETISSIINDPLETDAAEKLSEIRDVLKKILSPKMASAQDTKSTKKDFEVAATGDAIPVMPRDCSYYRGCGECVAAGCGWCLNDRACKEDKPWMCSGDHDHVGLGGVGKHRVCPSMESYDQARAERKRRKEEAKLAKADETNARRARGDNSTDDDSGSGGSATVQLSKDEKTQELLRRAGLAKNDYGKTHPYETLGIESTASSGEIRKAYRKLSLLYHPDKNTGVDRENADAAFKDIVAAFDILGDPEKRAFFDDMGGDDQQAFNNYEDYVKYGKKNEGNFYQGHKLITPLSEALWEKRVGFGDSVWLVEFYAPWCGHCQQNVPTYKTIADMLEEEEGIEVGAVNCATQTRVCNEWFAVRSYPQLMAINDHHGMRQEYQGNFEPLAVATWLKAVAKEWRWLMHASNLTVITSLEDFTEKVIPSQDFWVVVYLDGFDCSACKTAKTNAMRLSAGLHGYAGVSFGVVDCEDPDAHELCYESQGMPSRPHAPVAKGYQSGNKTIDDQGEILYNSNEVEPHVALEMLERTVRLALSDRLVDPSAAGKNEAGYEKDKKDEKKDDKKPPERPAQPMWNGPKRRDPVAWGGGGGGHFVNNPRLGHN